MEKLVPVGILEPVSGRSYKFFAPTAKPAISLLTVFFSGERRKSMTCDLHGCLLFKRIEMYSQIYGNKINVL
ncbi:MAG: hypothetical protein A2Y07_00210 [Planctomycetes bacterium GWF2_50_10]|nr:MAG: hypothetical protein A2Y07_00210 [Planctomycetes bacterium GWF2_50_10]